MNYKEIKNKILFLKPCKEGINFLNEVQPELWFEKADDKFINWFVREMFPVEYYKLWKLYTESFSFFKKTYKEIDLPSDGIQVVVEKFRCTECRKIVKNWLEKNLDTDIVKVSGGRLPD